MNLSAVRYPNSFISNIPLKIEVLGTCPIAKNTPSVLNSEVFPVFTFFNFTPVTFLPSPKISTTWLSQVTLHFGFLEKRSCMILEARNESCRWITVTLVQNLVRKLDSSIAESPPPITTTSFPLKKAPSQVAQVVTPRPLYFSSEGIPNHLALAPVATIKVLV